MSLTSTGKKGDLIRKRLALAMAANARIAAPDGKTGGTDPGTAEGRKTPITVKAHGGDSAEHKDTKYSLEGRGRFGFSSGTGGGETLTVNQPVCRTVTKIPRKSPALGRASLIPHKLDKSEQKDIENKCSLTNRDSKAIGLIEESRQRYDHSFHASNDFVSQNTSIKVRTSPNASHATRSVTQEGQSRNEAGHTTRMHATDTEVSSFLGKISDKPVVTPSAPTDINTIEEEVGRLKFDMHKMLEDFQNLNAFALQLQKQVKDVRSDRQEMSSS